VIVDVLAIGDTPCGDLPGDADAAVRQLYSQHAKAFAKQDAAKQDDDAGPGNGFVDVFAPNGNLLQRLASQGRLNSPWAVTLAPPAFGAFGGDILVGNFGDGRINAFDPATGQFLGQLRNHGGPITIPGLWGLRFPTGSRNVTPNALYFAAGPNHEADGLLGDIVPAQS
jgi:uncharacterized protein (TIGR03118 family)